MAQQSNVPLFGNWETEGNTPYTAYFEKARKKKTSVNSNVNNPEENPRMLSNNVPPVQAPPFQMDTESVAQKGRETLRTKHADSRSRENSDLVRSSASPLHHNIDHRHISKSSSDTHKRAIQPTVGPDRRVEHPHHQAKLGGKGNGASWERKSSTEGSNNIVPSTSGRSRPGSVTRGHQTPEYGATVPKFGDWDEANPASAEGFTHVFDRVREDTLNNRTGQVPIAATQNPHSDNRMQHDNEMSKRCFCFRWFGK